MNNVDANKILNGKLFTLADTPANPDILAAGPLSKQPGSTPYRIVLVRRDGKFVVYSQDFAQNDDNSVNLNKYSFSMGSYFESNELVNATKVFSDRVNRHAEYLESLYRED